MSVRENLGVANENGLEHERSRVDCVELMCIATVMVASKRLECREQQCLPEALELRNCDDVSDNSDCRHSLHDVIAAERLLVEVLRWEVTASPSYANHRVVATSA